MYAITTFEELTFQFVISLQPEVQLVNQGLGGAFKWIPNFAVVSHISFPELVAGFEIDHLF